MRSTVGLGKFVSKAKLLRARKWLAGISAGSLIGGLLVVAAGVPGVQAATIAPTVSVTPPASYIAGEDLVLDVTFTGTSGAGAQYNLSFGTVIPSDATFIDGGIFGEPKIYKAGKVLTGVLVPGTTPDTCEGLGLETATSPADACAVPAGKQYLVFQNIADLPESATVSGAITLRPHADVFEVGTEFPYQINGYTNSNPRYLPVFPGSTGVNNTDAKNGTSNTGANPGNVPVKALRIEKSEPSPENELLRGVHDNTTTYTLRIWHTGEGKIDDVKVTDYIPAGLEYLGLGGIDNTTNANGDRGGGTNSVEYDGAARLTATPAPAGSAWEDVADHSLTRNANTASTTESIETVEVDGAVYTKVTWNLGELLASGLAEYSILDPIKQDYKGTAGEPGFFEIRYRAAVPLFENTMDFGYEADTVGQQAANLDNNRGASTRHGIDTTNPANDAKTYTNRAEASGTYAGLDVSDEDTESIDAVDVRLLKSVEVGTGGFNQGEKARYTLNIATSEYVSAELSGNRPNRLVDDLGDGLCPVFPSDTPVTPDASEAGAGIPRLIIGNPNPGNPAVGDDLTIAQWNTALSSYNVGTGCEFPSTAADTSADALVGATLTGIAYDPVSGHFFMDYTLPEGAMHANNSAGHEVKYSVLQNSLYAGGGQEDGSTTSGDSFTNTAEIHATTYAIDPVWDLKNSQGISAGTEEQAWDDSESAFSAELVQLDKSVLKRSAGVPSRNDVWKPDYENDWVKKAEDNEPFSVGDQVWYRIVVIPPSGADVRNPVLTDFLPAGVSFDDESFNDTTGRYEDMFIVPTNYGSGLPWIEDCQADPDATTDSEKVLDWLNTFIPQTGISIQGQSIKFKMGSSECYTDSTDRFMPLLAAVEVYIKVTVTDAAAFGSVDIPYNLAKYQQENVEGEVFQLRDQAESEFVTAPQLVKGIERNTFAGISGLVADGWKGVAPGPDYPAGSNFDDTGENNGFLSDVDGEYAVQKDEITFRVDVRSPLGSMNNTVKTQNYEIWDALPEGVTKADVVTASDKVTLYVEDDTPPETTTTNFDFEALDPGDAGYPADLSAAYNGRTVLKWLVKDSIDGSVSDASGEPQTSRGFSLHYTIKVPSDSTGSPRRDALLQQHYQNTASIVEYESVTNAGGGDTASLVPNGDNTLRDNGSNQDVIDAGKYPVAEKNTYDDSWFDIPNAAMKKELVTTEIPSTSPDVTDPLNPENVIVQGELATYDISVKLPANTTVRNGVLADNGKFVGQSGNGTMSPNTADYQVYSAVVQAAPGVSSGTVPTGFIFEANTGKLIFPEYYQTGDDPEIFTVRLVVWVKDIDASHPEPGTADRPQIPNNKVLRNTATFNSQNIDGDNNTPITDMANVTYREPNLKITKSADPDTDVTINDVVTYTLEVSNANRVKTYDNWVEDTVPEGLFIQSGSFRVGTTADPSLATGIADSALTFSGNVINGEGGTITWSHAQIAGLQEIPDSVYLFYDAKIDPSTGAGEVYENTATVTGYTLPDDILPTGERRGDRTSTDSAEITAVDMAITKGVRVNGTTDDFESSTSAPVGETVQYQVDVTLKAHINYYDPELVDVMPTGVQLQPGWTVTDVTDAGNPIDDTSNWSLDSTNEPTYVWSYDSHILSAQNDRILRLTYTAKVTDNITAESLPNTVWARWKDNEGEDQESEDKPEANVDVLNPVLSIVKKVDDEDSITRNPDASFDYKITVSNSGTAQASLTPAHNITVQDVVPAGVKVDTNTISPTPAAVDAGVSTGEGGKITWQFAGPLYPATQAGSGKPNSQDFTYTASFIDSTELSDDTLQNVANVTHFESFEEDGRSYDPPLTGDDAITDDADVTPLFPFVVPQKSVTTPVEGEDYGIAYVGGDFNWTLKVTNTGAGIAKDISVTDTLPKNWEYVGNALISVNGGAQAVLAAPTLTPATVGTGDQQVISWSAATIKAASATPLAADDYFEITFDAKPLTGALTDAGTGIKIAPHTNTLSVTATDTQDNTSNEDGDYAGNDSTADAYIAEADLKLVKEAIGGVVEQSDPDDNLYGQAAGTWLAGQGNVAGKYAQPQWQITVTNHGPDASYGPFEFTDTPTLPTGVTIDWTTLTATVVNPQGGQTASPAITWSGVVGESPFTVGAVGTYLTAGASGAAGPDSLVLTVDVNIDAGAQATGKQLSNIATVDGRTYEDPENKGPEAENPNVDEAEKPLISLADLAIEKVVNTTNPTAGGTVTWQLNPSNNGPDISRVTATKPITITDVIPAGISGVANPSVAVVGGSAGWTATLGVGETWPAKAGDTITWTYVPATATPTWMPIGAAPSITLTGTIDADWTDGTIVNAAVIAPGDTPDPVEENNEDDVPVDPGDDTTLSIAKTRVVKQGADWVPTTADVEWGDPVSYRITVTNNGPAVARNVKVVDETPAGLEYNAHESVVGTWTHASGGTSSNGTNATWDTFTLTSGTPPGNQLVGPTNSTSFVVTYNTDPAMAPTDPDAEPPVAGIHNWAEASATNSTNKPRDDDNTDSKRVADLSITKSHTGDAVAGTELTYTLMIENHGPSISDAPIKVTDTLPTGMSYVAGSASQTPSSVSGQVITWNDITSGVTLAKGGKVTITFKVLIDASVAEQKLVNSAVVDGPNDPNPENDYDEDPTDVKTEVAMTIVKDVEAGPWVAGTDVTYTVTIANEGPSYADNVSVTDTILDPGITLKSITPSAGLTTDWDCDANLAEGTVEALCAYDGRYPAEATTTFTVVGHIAASAPISDETEPLVNKAVLRWTDSEEDVHERDDDAPVWVTTEADLGIVKTAVDVDGAQTDKAVAGEHSFYRLLVTNHGPSDAQGPITVTDSLPSGMGFVGLTGEAAQHWDVEVDATNPRNLTFTLKGGVGLAALTDAPLITYEVSVSEKLANGDDLENAVEVSSPTEDPNPDNNKDKSRVKVKRVVDVAISKSHSEKQVRIGDQLDFALRVVNLGPSRATEVVVTDTVPYGLEVLTKVGDEVGKDWTIESVEPVDPADVTAGTRVVASYAKPLAPGAETSKLTLSTKVLVEAYSKVTNKAKVEVAEKDIDLSNNKTKDPVVVPALATLVVKKESVGTFVEGGEGKYLITVTNIGPTEDPGPITVTDKLPAGLSFSSSPDKNVQVDGNTVTWTLAKGLQVDESVVLTLFVNVDELGIGEITNTVILHSPTEHTPDSKPSDDDTVEVLPPEPGPGPKPGPNGGGGHSGPLSWTGLDVGWPVFGALLLLLLGMTGVGLGYRARRRNT